MDPGAADQLAATQRQLVLFAHDVRSLVATERAGRAEVEQALRELRSSYRDMIRTLAFVVEAKDSYTAAHLDRTYHWAIALSRRVAPELVGDATIGYGFLLHDIGKVGVPESILMKPGPLTDEEWAVMRLHPLLGVHLVTPIKILGDALHVIRSHHERWDGSGYPQQLAGEDIHVAARIFSVVDTFDAMTSDRPYRRRLPVAAAMEEIERGGGTQFDPDVAAAFVAFCEDLRLDETESVDTAH